MNEELEHLLELDPIKSHDKIMELTRPPPVIVHKEYTGRQPPLPDNGDEPPQVFNDDQLDVLAQAVADLRIEFQSTIDDAMGPLAEAVAVLQGQVGVLLNLIDTIVGNNNNNNNPVKEASETRTKTVRRVRQIESKPR